MSDENQWNSAYAVALFNACLYHGISALNTHTRPPRVDTVLSTADEFVTFMEYHRQNIPYDFSDFLEYKRQQTNPRKDQQ